MPVRQYSTRSRGVLCWYVLAAVIVAIASTSAIADTINYQTVKQWPIPNGGFGRVIVVDPKYRNERDMRALAKQFQLSTAKDRNAFIFVYDDSLAASRRDAAIKDALGRKEVGHHDAHFIGSYIRNINTGYHKFQIMLQGVNGTAIEINP